MDKFIQNIAKQAGRSLLQRFHKVGVKYTKANITDVVTEADLVSNQIIIEAIKKKYPSHGIISEETGGFQENAEYIWIIDPLDGTLNFASGIPLFQVMIGLAYKNKMQLAVVYDPLHRELYFAKAGHGAFLNGKRIKCAAKKEIYGTYGYPDFPISESNLKIINNLLKINKGIWFSGIVSIVSQVAVAAGRTDWYISRGGPVWEYAQIALIMQEAGCRVTNFSGRKWRLYDKELLATNKYLHPKLLKLVNE